MKFIKYLLFFIIALFALIFACLNAQLITINYFFGTATLPLSLIVVIALALGCLLGFLALLLHYFRQKTLTLRLAHRLKAAEKELSNLRALPLKRDE